MAKDQAATAQFELLAAELDTMTKALPAAEAGGGGPGDDEDAARIAAAAAAAGGAGGGTGDDEGDLDADGKPMGKPVVKALEVTLPDGTKTEGYDATALVKSLQDQIEAQGSGMAKAMGAAVALLKKQGEQLTANTKLVKSLTEQVETLRSQGAGRKAVVTAVPKTPLTPVAKALDGVSPQEFLAKASAAYREQRLDADELNLAEALINRREQVPAYIVAKVLPPQQ